MLLERFNDELRPEEGGPVDDGATPRAVFYADRAGDYLVDLTVTDRLNAVAPGPACPSTSCTRSCCGRGPLRYSCRDALGYTRGR